MAPTSWPGSCSSRSATALRGLDAAERTEVRHSGLENILGQPEFSAAARRQGVLALLRGGAFLSAVLPQLAAGPDVQVFIGDENPADELRRFGVVVSTYGVDGEVTGVLGVARPDPDVLRPLDLVGPLHGPADERPGGRSLYRVS